MPIIDEISVQEIESMVESCGYHLGYDISNDMVWSQYIILFGPPPPGFFQGVINDTLLSWLREDIGSFQLWELFTTQRIKIEEYLRLKGVRVEKLYLRLQEYNLSIDMDLPSEVREAIEVQDTLFNEN